MLEVRDLRLDREESNIKHQTSNIQHPTSNIKIIAIEQSKDSIPYTKAAYTMPVALLVGNETFGVSEEALSAVDEIVEIPMWGINKSLNVIVSAAIVGYHAISTKK